MRAVVLTCLGVLLSLSCAAESPVVEPEYLAGDFTIATKRENDAVEVKREKDITLFDIASPFGISEITITSKAERWPDKVAVRLWLKGLEHFSVSNGVTTIAGSCSTSDATRAFRFHKNCDETTPLDPKDADWIDGKIVDRPGKKPNAAPLVDGFFELTLPKTLFVDQPKSLMIKFIDFYRQ